MKYSIRIIKNYSTNHLANKTNAIFSSVIFLMVSIFLTPTSMASGIILNPGESIQAAIDSLPPQGGVVQLAAGTWNISETILIKKSNIILRGSGMASTHINMIADPPGNWGSGYTNPMILAWMNDTPTATLTNISIEDLHLIGRYTPTNRKGENIKFRNVQNSTIQRADIEKGGYDAIGLEYSTNITVSDSRVHDNKLGITTRLADYNLFSNLTVYSFEMYGMNINAENAPGITGLPIDNYGNIIENNEFYDMGVGAAYIYSGSYYTTFRNNIVHDTSSTGVDIYLSMNDVIENNIIYNVKWYGIVVHDNEPYGKYSTNITIRNNILYNNGFGIYVSQQTFVNPINTAVLSNTVFGSTYNGITITSDVRGAIVINNIVTNSGGWGIYNQGFSSIITTYNDAYKNTGGNYYGVYGTGNLEIDPLFADTKNKDFHLKSQYNRWTPTGWVTDSVTSPAIGTGAPYSDNSRSPWGGTIEMGAYGNTLQASKGTGIDITPSTITSTDPFNGAINILVTKTITVTFSENIQSSTNYNSISLKNANNAVSITKSISGTVLTIVPSALSYNTTYTVTIPAAAIKDLSNNDLANPYSFSFTTSAQPVLTNIEVSPSSPTVTSGSTQQITAQPKDQFSNLYPAAVTWTSSNTTVGTINSAGLFTAITAGTITITASNGSVSGTATATVVQQAQGSGFVAYWKFDEGSGTIASDSSGNGNTGSIFGATWVTGRIGSYALSFDGAANYVDVPNSANVNLGSTGDSYTISAWIKTTSMSPEMQFLTKGWFQFTRLYPFQLRVGSGKAYFIIYDGSTYPAVSSVNNVNDGLWHYVAGVRDTTTGKIFLYVDGELVASTADTTTASMKNTAGINIGRGYNYFSGAIDDVKIYNRTLSAQEIMAEYQAGGISTSASTILSGTVIDATNSPILGARINTNGYLTTTNSSGSYTLSLPPGSYISVASKTGYESKFQQVALIENQTTIANFQLPLGPSSTNTILWDTTNKYTWKYPFDDAFANKANWIHVPYGLTNYTWIGDPMIENGYYYMFLMSNTDDSPPLYAKLPNFNWYNELYKVYDTGTRDFGNGAIWTIILNNTPNEVAVKSAGKGDKTGLDVTTIYRATNKNWLEIRPLGRVNQLGMHDKTRLAAFLYQNVSADVLLDANKHGSFDERVNPQSGTIGLLNLHRKNSPTYDEDFMWFLTFPPGTETNSLTYHDISVDSYWEWDCRPCSPSVDQNFAYLGEKVIVGVLNNKDNWEREDVGQTMTAGQTYTTAFVAPYAGKWRMVGVYSDDDWNITDYFSEVNVNEGDRFTFTSQRSGTLEYLVLYLFDRTANTPTNVKTPMDVYRETIVSPLNPAPSITTFSPSNLTPSIAQNTTTPFTVATSQQVGSAWYLNGVNQNNNAQAWSHGWDTPGQYNVTYAGSNSNGSVSISWNVTVIPDTNPLSITNPAASPSTIPDDTDNNPTWGETSSLSLTVTGSKNIASVTIDLSPIGGGAAKPMINTGGNIWSVTASASAGTPPGTYNLKVKATDIDGNSDTSVTIPLTVVKNGDMNSDGYVNIADAVLLGNYVSYPGQYSISSEYAADVTGDGVVNIGDALYIGNYATVPGLVLK